MPVLAHRMCVFAHLWSGTDEHHLHCSDSDDVINVVYIAM